MCSLFMPVDYCIAFKYLGTVKKMQTQVSLPLRSNRISYLIRVNTLCHSICICRPKAALLFWFFVGFRCGMWLCSVIIVRYENRKYASRLLYCLKYLGTVRKMQTQVILSFWSNRINYLIRVNTLCHSICIFRPKAALLFWFFGGFRCGMWLFFVILVR